MAALREKVADGIRDLIIRGELRPGQRLVEREMCERLDVSRATLRESYRQLEGEGLLLMTPNKGPTVTRMTAREAMFVYEVREALECFAVRLFVERASDEQVEQLLRAVEAARNAYSTSDVAIMLSVKAVFYEVLYTGADNPTLWEQARILNHRLARLRVRSLSRSGRPEESIREIQDVCRFIKRRQPELAEAAWRDHIRNAATAALEEMDGADEWPAERKRPPARKAASARRPTPAIR